MINKEQMISRAQLHYLMLMIGRGQTHPWFDGRAFDLFRLGAELPLPSSDAHFYGVVRKPVPPREEGGALPGLGSAGSFTEANYSLASRAWMHVNCTRDEYHRDWKRILELCRQGKPVPKDIIPE